MPTREMNTPMKPAIHPLMGRSFAVTLPQIRIPKRVRVVYSAEVNISARLARTGVINISAIAPTNVPKMEAARVMRIAEAP